MKQRNAIIEGSVDEWLRGERYTTPSSVVLRGIEFHLKGLST